MSICSVPLIFVVISCAAGALADDGEPTLRGKTVTQWLEMLHGRESKLEDRQRALLALRILGPKVRGVVPGLGQALRKNPEPSIRRGAAQYLGQMGDEAQDAI